MFHDDERETRPVQGEADWSSDESPDAKNPGEGGESRSSKGDIIQVAPSAQEKDKLQEGRDEYWIDVDRMVNEGLGAGHVGNRSGKIEESPPFRDE